MKRKCLFLLLLLTIFVLSVVGAVSSGIYMASSQGEPVIYADPPYNSAPVGQYLTINISIANVTNLNSWQAKLYVKPSILETNISMIQEGPFLSQNGTFPTEFNANPDPPFWGVGGRIMSLQSVNGSGTLASITFKVIGEGQFILYFSEAETKLRDPDLFQITHTSENGYFSSEKVEVVNEVEVDGKNFTIITTTSKNFTVSPVPFNISIELKEISFSVNGPEGMTGYCNVTIPKSFMNCTDLDDWTVTVNGGSSTYFPTPTDNATHTFVYFTFATSVDKVQIESEYIVPEFPAIIFFPLFIIATMAATLVAKKVWPTRHNCSRN